MVPERGGWFNDDHWSCRFQGEASFWLRLFLVMSLAHDALYELCEKNAYISRCRGAALLASHHSCFLRLVRLGVHYLFASTCAFMSVMARRFGNHVLHVRL